MFLILSYWLYLVIFEPCVSTPVCCQKSYLYSDFHMTLKCGISFCKSKQMTFGNLCIACGPGAHSTNQSTSNYVSKITKPEKICQGLQVKDNSTIGRILLSWPMVEETPFSSIFLVEARNQSEQIGEWSFVGMTNETFADVTNLSLEFEYQFRLTPIVGTANTISPVLSNWISIRDSKFNISAPTAVSITEFHVNQNRVDVLITWNASKELPCSYKVYWLPANNQDYFEQKTLILPTDSLSATLPGLMYGTNYSVTVSPHDQNQMQSVQAIQVWFVTPTCLTLTGGNFSTCAPGSPLNASAHWLSSETQVMLMWYPPLHTSLQNHILSYHLTVVEAAGIFRNVLQHRSYMATEPNSTYTIISRLNPSASYIFEIRAISRGGMSLPAVVDLSPKEVGVMSLASAGSEIPHHYIAPILSAFVILSGILIALRWFRHKNLKKQGYPSGLADVDDDTRPFLVTPDKIELKEIIGQGAFATAYRGLFARDSKSKDEVAVKMFPSDSITRRQLLHEVDILRLVGRHEHVVGFIGFTLDIERIFLILEYCRFGNLHSHLVSLKPKLMYMLSLLANERPVSSNERSHGIRLSSYIFQVAQGMEYISSLKLIHGDIAARNILLCDEKRVKIGDFGLSKDVYETKNYSSLTQNKLPIKWMAPEAIEKQKFSTFTDVWAFGVFMWEVFKLGNEPYPGLKSVNVLGYLKMGYRLELPHCGQEWYDIMCSCWRRVPRERPRFKELVRKIAEIMDSMSHYIVLS